MSSSKTLAILFMAVGVTGMVLVARAENSYLLPAVPDGFHLQAYDDCGVPGRQPHVKADCGVHTFGAEVQAPLKARTVACGIRKIESQYDKLDPHRPYVLAITYANEPYNHRIQSLWADGIQLHGPRELPKGKHERLVFTVPPEATKDGALTLEFRLEAQVNVVVSAVELWSTAPSPSAVHLNEVYGLNDDLRGSVLDLAYEPLAGVDVEVSRTEGGTLANVKTDSDGNFTLKREVIGAGGKITDLKVTAIRGEARDELTIPESALVFEPVHYRPVASRVNGLQEHRVRLDGVWRIRTEEPAAARRQPLDAPGWGEFRVPGQWLQQGHDIPQERPVAVAGEFDVPAGWKDYRVFLRFDSIHAGTRYWVNAKELGSSENLYTPVEWEVTDAVRSGQRNRLDLLMKVDTPSERLSYASGYAFHNLGGIDRSVWLYALPKTHIRSLQVLTDLDHEFRDGRASVNVEVDGSGTANFELTVTISDPNGKEIAQSALPIGEMNRGRVHTDLLVRAPKQWSDEKPNLHTLTLELKRGSDVLERVERRIGFRKIEVRGRQLFLNGRRIKLAGVCRHEIDPLTGRADTMRHAEPDLKMLKDANFNYVRTSHYPPPEELLDATDRLGIFLEVEAPLCWVGEQWGMEVIREVLTPTSAMIDCCHSHPSVLIWSLANESQLRPFFRNSNRLCKELDPTRPTTFNNPDPAHVCDIANLHYPPMPYDEAAKGDPRPVFLGEYLFPVCHEQTDVRINPGLRELWAAGHSEPDSAWGKECAAVFDKPLYLMPGARPGAWSHIYRSDAVLGGAIWAALDEPFYLPGGKHAGYYWVHGPWGLIDAWRRPKPELWLSKLMFSPVWFPVRQVEFSPGQSSIRLPVENRFAFTNLNELQIAWEYGSKKGTTRADVPPGSSGLVEIPIPPGAKAGDEVILRVTDTTGRLVNVLSLRLGQRRRVDVPKPRAGSPEVEESDGLAVISGKDFRLVVDKAAGQLKSDDPRHSSSLLRGPALHLTRFDFGDLRQAPPYAVLPDEKTRQVEQVRMEKRPEGLAIEIHDRYAMFAGSTRWLIDRDGVGEVTCDYIYTGDELYAREIGIRLALAPDCQTLKWRRWSEWGIYPEDHIGRTEGTATARRDPKWPEAPESVRPSWPWALDQTELGTTDFRSAKFNIYEASLTAPAGRGVSVRADADAHVRACLSDGVVLLHVLSECRLGPVTLKNGDRVQGKFYIQLRGEK